MPVQDAKYQQVIAWVKENIENGNLKRGDRLMSENELSRRFGLSRQTIRHATGALENQGYLVRVQGSGTYIGTGTVSSPVRREQTMRIAVISTFYERYIFPDTLRGIEGVLTDSGYAMQVAFTNNELFREEAILKAILEQDNVDGLVVEPVKSALPNPNMKYYKEILQRQIPVLFFNTFYPGIDAPCVRLDDIGVARKATELLIQAGHTRIAGIFKSDDGQGPRRYQGFVEAMLAAGLSFDEKQVILIDTAENISLEDISDYLFSRIEGCSAVVCYNDQVAYQLIGLALDRGLQVPGELSVVGIDDSYLAGMSRVPFTSFPHPKEMLGERVGETILQMINDPHTDGNYLFDSDPVMRDSVRIISLVE